jgi:CBS domain-containing protein
MHDEWDMVTTRPLYLKVSDLMTTSLVTVKPGTALSHADAEMRWAGIRHLLVVDDRQHLIGILSNRDLLGALARSGGKAVHVVDVMTRNVRTVTAEVSARRAAALLLEQKIGCLPVVGDDGQLVGIVTETDFLRVAYELLGRP